MVQPRNLIDPYSLHARLEPALLTVLPTFVTVAIWFPSLFASLQNSLLGIVLACGILTLLANVARQAGKRREQELWLSWGGNPTVQLLRFRDGRIDSGTLTTIHEFLARNVPNWPRPTVENERSDPTGTDAVYAQAVRWLLEYTRDTKRYPLVYKELIGYGFRRNLYGMRPIGYLLTISCFVGISAAVCLQVIAAGGAVDQLEAKHIISLVLVCFAIGLWSSISAAFVKASAFHYAERLLAACYEPRRAV